MSDDYKAGYENGRYAAFHETFEKVNKQSDRLFEKLAYDKYKDRQIESFVSLEEWLIKEMKAISND